MAKANLVLIHSFPTNSLVLRGFTDFLSDYFEVYFVDLPGFNQTAPLKKITLDGYSRHVQREVERLNFNSYWLGGISFGFLVANNIDVDESCRGLAAIEPFIGMRYMRRSLFLDVLSPLMLNMVRLTGSQGIAYRSRFFKYLLTQFCSKQSAELIRETVNPSAFFETARLIMAQNSEPSFKSKPYLLVLNPDDSLIFSDRIETLFRKLETHIVIHSTSDHFPEALTKAYFARHLDKRSMDRILGFVEAHS